MSLYAFVLLSVHATTSAPTGDGAYTYTISAVRGIIRVCIFTTRPTITLFHLLPSLFIYFSHPPLRHLLHLSPVPGTSSAVRRAPVHSQTDTCLYAVRVSSDSSASLPDGIDTLRTFADYSSGGCVPPADRVISGPAAADVLANRILAVDVPRYHYCQGQPAGCECRCDYNIVCAQAFVRMLLF